MPTFGTTTIGPTPATQADSQLVANPYSLAEDGWLTKMTVYVSNGGGSNQKWRLAVYADSSGSPAAFKGVTTEITIAAGQSAGWVDATFASPLHLPTATYWLCIWGGPTANQASRYRTSAGTLNFVSATYSSSSNPPDPFGSASSASQTHSLYATYDATPVNTVAPSVSGSAPVGSTLSTTDGTWSNSPTFTYAWARDGSPIGGATSSTYVTVSADAGHAVGCTVTATNGVATASQASSNTVTVTAAGPVNTVPPVVSGNQQVGSTLTCTTGTWE